MSTTTFRTDAWSVHAARWWRCRPWSTNSLMSWPDRTVAAVRLFVLVLGVAIVPLAAALGTSAYSDDAARIRTERALTTTVAAEVIEAPQFDDAHVRRAPVLFAGPAGPVRTTVEVSRTISRGDVVEVWLDQAGTPVDEPREPGAAVVTGVAVAAMVMACTAFAGWCLITATVAATARLRGRAIDREWLAMQRAC
ncbi:Rv1733c family protein [Nocardia rhizosphaerae]|uniref:Transmembrane protein n=1 Tax=Nocardia rhizosphaerae TaxID=1691571 RepID=A0ABV8LCM6_9NOCA